VTIQAAIARRLAFVDALDWEIRTVEGADPVLAQEQADLLRYAYDRIDNLKQPPTTSGGPCFAGSACWRRSPPATGRWSRDWTPSPSGTGCRTGRRACGASTRKADPTSCAANSSPAPTSWRSKGARSIARSAASSFPNNWPSPTGTPRWKPGPTSPSSSSAHRAPPRRRSRNTSPWPNRSRATDGVTCPTAATSNPSTPPPAPACPTWNALITATSRLSWPPPVAS
jgi:hypothetical protein